MNKETKNMMCKKVGDISQFEKILTEFENEVMNIEQIVVNKGGYYGMVQ